MLGPLTVFELKHCAVVAGCVSCLPLRFRVEQLPEDVLGITILRRSLRL